MKGEKRMDNNMVKEGWQYERTAQDEPQINNLAEIEKLGKKAKRLRHLGIGSILYALIYTFCLYRNASGITYPFFVGATLLYFGYYTREYTESCSREHSLWVKASWYRRFLAAAALILGALNCMTDSGALIFFNKVLLLLVLGVLALQTWHDVSGWSIAAHLKGLFHLAIGIISQIFTPFYDWGASKKLRRQRGEPDAKNNSEEKKRILVCVSIGLVIGLPLVCILLMLLGSADVVFYNLVCDLLSFRIDVDFADFLYHTVSAAFMAFVVFIGAYGVFCYCNDPADIKAVDEMAVRREKGFDTYIAVTISTLVCVIYLVFSCVQIFGLFMGRLKLPEGYTYAEYARSGFFQLVFVCLINVVLVLCMLAYFETGRALRAILCVICGCTYIMEVSGLFRLLMYIEMYHLTFTRVLALWGLAVIAIVMGGVTYCIFCPKFRLFQYALVAVSICWMLFSAAHPDYWIAKYNIAMSATCENVDTYYIKNRLSMDAAPALVEAEFNFIGEYGEMNGKYKEWRIKDYQEETKGLLGFRHFNFSKAYACSHDIDGLNQGEKAVKNP